MSSTLKGYIRKRYQLSVENNLDGPYLSEEDAVSFTYSLMMRYITERDQIKEEGKALMESVKCSSEMIECYERFIVDIMREHDIDNSDLLKQIDAIDSGNKKAD